MLSAATSRFCADEDAMKHAFATSASHSVRTNRLPDFMMRSPQLLMRMRRGYSRKRSKSVARITRAESVVAPADARSYPLPFRPRFAGQPYQHLAQLARTGHALRKIEPQRFRIGLHV